MVMSDSMRFRSSNKLVERYGKWIETEHGTHADFSGANLANIDMSTLSLRGANFDGVYMNGAVLRGSLLRRASFVGAGLIGASFEDAGLQNADFTNASLRGAILTGADLNGAKFDGARLSGSCLDKRLLQWQRKFCRQCPPNRYGGRIVYRTVSSLHVGRNEYEPGVTYIAPMLSFDVVTECHPGIYAASLRWMRLHYQSDWRLAKCYVRDGDWIITAKGAIRCKRLRVLEIVNV